MMSRRLPPAALALAALVLPAATMAAEACANDAPNPYADTGVWGRLPAGRTWGSTAGVSVAPDGNIWAIDRCGANSCADSNLPSVLEFAPDGRLLRAIGAGLFVFPHSLTVAPDGGIWVADAQAQGDRGMQAVKLSPDGKVLLRLGVAGKTQGEGALDQPTAVAASPAGDIYVTEGHSPTYGRSQVVHYDKTGRRLGVIGIKGSGPGQLLGPHAVAVDSKGRLIVGDRGNNRVQIFEANGKPVAAWTQFGRPSAVFVDARDTLYVADSESMDAAGPRSNPGCKRGIRVGALADGKVSAFIPDPDPAGDTSAAEGVAVDRSGAVYGAEVRSMDIKKYVRK